MPLIFDIKRYAINDGPGIRTTLFFKGCPLRCVWCHNPESWSPRPQMLYKKGKCMGCSTCVDLCPQHALKLGSEGIVYAADLCVNCGLCTEECPTMALEMCGREWTIDELMVEIEKEREVMEDSGGGVTLCGGEPLMHPEDTMLVLQALGERGFHRVVDTSLHAPRRVVADVASACELMLVDLKMMDAGRHRQLTGVDNGLILDNIRWLAEQGYDFSIRIPLIEGVNATDDQLTQTADFLQPLPWRRRVIHLLPYHDVGKDKHCRMWSTFNPMGVGMSAPSEERLQHCASLLRNYGFQVVIGG